MHPWRRAALLPLAIACSGVALAETGTGPIDARALEPLVVTGTRTPHALDSVPVETVLLDRADLERSGAGNLAAALGTVPGIDTSLLDDVIGADNLRSSMRGLQFNEGYGLILVDGQRVHGGLGAHGDYGVSLNQIPLSMVERVEVVRGAGSALYGADAMAGVVNVITRPVPSGPVASAGTSFGRYEMLDRAGQSPRDRVRTRLRSHAAYGDRVGERSGYYLHYSREEDEGNDASSRLTTRDALFSRWETDFPGPFSLGLSADVERSRRELPAGPSRFDREYDSYRLAARTAYDEGRYRIAVQGYTYQQDFTQGYPGFDHGYRQGDIGYRQAEIIATRFGDRHWLTVGAEGQRQRLDYRSLSYVNGQEQPPVDVDERVNTYSIYVQDEIQMGGGRFVLVPGLRYESHDTFGDEFNPKLSALWRATRDTTVRASAGRAFKSPTIRQLYYDGLMRHGGYYVESNPDLAPETAYRGTLNLEQRLADGRGWYSLGYFRTTVRDRVIRRDSGEVNADDGIPIHTYANVDRALIQGAELSWRAELPAGFRLSGSAAYTEAEDRSSGSSLPFVPRYSVGLAPEWTGRGGLGAGARIARVGHQYRDDAENKRVDAHTVVDLRAWQQLSRLARLTLDGGNVFASDRGDSDYGWRLGRSLTVGLSIDY
ncbi:MAG: TonB-dependent receptor [Ectothiorhodospiraceae bacterium]|nr:TonB-dependent receptor [Ectothiorhodospiraceae bacterium]